MHRILRWTPVVVVLAVVPITMISYLGDRDSDAPEPIDVQATGTRFETLDELKAAADLVIEGHVVGVEDGRTISDPTDPDAGIRTRLAQINVDLAADASSATPRTVVVEQEATLLDGTPITVNGVAPLDVGERAVLLLVRGADDQFPYTTPISEQAVFYVVDDEVVAADPEGPIGSVFHGGSAAGLRDALVLRAPVDQPGT
jgi:hypothetical protein